MYTSTGVLEINELENYEEALRNEMKSMEIKQRFLKNYIHLQESNTL